MNVVLVYKTGGDFGLADVNLLVEHLIRYWDNSKPLHIYVLTDIVSEPKDNSEYGAVGYTMLPLEYAWPGWWSKMNMFSPSLNHLKPFLYFDLDTMILGDVSKYILDENLNDFITLRQLNTRRNIGSGIMQIPDNIRTQHIWNKWIEKPDYYMSRFSHGGDQLFMYYVTMANKFWDEITNKVDTAKPKGVFRDTKPTNLDICYFHGQPRIIQAAVDYKWVRDYLDDRY